MSKREESQTVILEAARIGYCNGRSADLIQGCVGGVWGAVFMLSPNSLVAIEAAGRQLSRSRAKRLRYIRRARIKSRSESTLQSLTTIESVILTELPSGTQFVVALDDGQTVKVKEYLEDQVLKALREVFIPLQEEQS